MSNVLISIDELEEIYFFKYHCVSLKVLNVFKSLVCTRFKNFDK